MSNDKEDFIKYFKSLSSFKSTMDSVPELNKWAQKYNNQAKIACAFNEKKAYIYIDAKTNKKMLSYRNTYEGKLWSCNDKPAKVDIQLNDDQYNKYSSMSEQELNLICIGNFDKNKKTYEWFRDGHLHRDNDRPAFIEINNDENCPISKIRWSYYGSNFRSNVGDHTFVNLETGEKKYYSIW